MPELWDPLASRDVVVPESRASEVHGHEPGDGQDLLDDVRRGGEQQ